MGASITFRRRLEWGDTDAAGYWHHSTFWKFAEAGEAELMRDLGLTTMTFGYTPRKSVSAEFSRPIYFDEEATITFSVERVGRTSATYHVRAEVDGELAAEGRLVAVLTKDGEPIPWPDHALVALKG